MSGVASVYRPRIAGWGAPSLGTAIVVVIGAIFGVVAIFVAPLETRWIVYGIAALGFVTLALAFPHPERLVWGGFVLSFQADVCVRFFYGRASTPGIPVGLQVVAGGLVVAAYAFSGKFTRLRPFWWGGRLALPIAGFFATSLLALPTSGERFVGVAEVLVEVQCYFVYLLALNAVRSEEQLDRTVRLLFIALGIQSIVYFIESALRITFSLTGEVTPELGVVPRPGGTVATNPAGFASFILPILLIAVAHVVSSRKRGRDLYVGGLVALGVTALTLTFTRASWTAFAIALTWLLCVAARRGTLRLGRIVPVGIAVCIAIVLFWPMIQLRLADSPVGDAYGERAGLMRMALRVIAAQPLTGVGPGAYMYTFKAFLTPELRDQWLAPVHNAYLLRAAEAGIPGGLAWVILLVAGLRQAVRLTRSRRPLIRVTAIGWSAGLLALCWEMSWDIWRGFTYNALLWFLLGLMEAAERIARGVPSPAGYGSGSTERTAGGLASS